MRVVIVGAGVAGLAIGWRLVQAGAEVTVLERARPASGATWAAAGMIAVTAEMAEADEREIEFSRYSNVLWPCFAEQIEAASGRPVGYYRSGTLLLAEDAAAADRLRARLAPGLHILTPTEARERAPLLADDFAAALWAPDEAHVDNRALGFALTAAFQRAGGRLVANEAVVKIERHEGRAAAACTPFGVYRADHFVLAAGAWCGLLEEALAPITPVKGEMIALEARSGADTPDVFQGPMVWGHGVYIVPRGTRLLVGATMETVGFDTRPTDAGREYLRERACALMPALADWSVAEHWAGLRPRSPDGLPLLGPTAVEGLWLAAGQFRNGILFAPAIAETMRDMLLGQAAPSPAFDPRRLVS